MRLGEYQTLRELRRSGAASLWEVEPVGGGGGGAKLAAKILQPPAFWSDDERSARVTRFLERARLQERAAAAGKHWAPVHALGENADEAHYVTDLYPSTAEQLIRKPKGALDGVGLFRIVRGIVAGLLELKDAEGRSHGRLTPGNVLLTSENLAAASVALSDPAVEAARGGEAADCRAVGELIFALVTRRAAEPGDVAKPSPAWRALGPRGSRWRDLCNQLLDPAQPLDSIEAVRDAVKLCRPPKVSRKQALRVAIVAVLLVGTGAGLWAYRAARHKKYVNDWEALCRTADWLPDFVIELNGRGGARLNTILSAIPDRPRAAIRALAAEAEVRPTKIRGPRDSKVTLEKDPPEDTGNLTVVRQVTTIMAGVRAVEELRQPDKWELLKSAQQLGDEYGRGSKNRAQAIAKAADEIMTPVTADRKGLASNIEMLAEYKEWLPPLHRLAASLKVVDAANNSDAKLRDELDQYVASVIGFSTRSSDLSEVTNSVRVADGVAGAVGKLASGKYDVQRFREERSRTAKDTGDLLAKWTEELAQYRVLEGEENPLRPEYRFNWRDEGRPGVPVEGTPVPWDQVLDGMDKDIEGVKDDRELVDGARLELGNLSGQLKSLKRRPTLVKDKGQVERDLQRFLAKAGEIRRALLKDDKTAVAQFEKDLKSRIDPLKSGDFVDGAKSQELSRVLDLNWRLRRKQRQVEAVDAFFKQLPDVPRLAIVEKASGRPWATELDSVAKARRDTSVRDAIKEGFGGRVVEGDALKASASSARERFDAWLARAERLGEACLRLEDRLNQYPLPSDNGGGLSKTVLELRSDVSGNADDQEILAALARVTDRADALINTAGTPPKELNRILAKGEVGRLPRHLESQLAAWRLAEPRGIPLVGANAFRQDLVDRLSKEAADKSIASAVAKEVDDIWRKKIAGPEISAPRLGDEMEVLAAARKLLDATPNPPLAEADLDAAGRYNVTVYRLRQAAADAEKDDKLKELEGNARRAAEGVKQSPAGEVATVLEAWLKRAEPVKGTLPIDQAGPAGTKDKLWKYEGPGITYKTASGLRLDFVDLPGADCYMCTTEVSVELFSAVMGASGPDGLKDLADKPGIPQVWVKKGNTLESAEDWFTVPAGKAATYAPNKGDWSRDVSRIRSRKFPMQWIPPDAVRAFVARMNCQIPTERQWKAALDEELKVNRNGTWNLRDQVSWQANLNSIPAGATAASNWIVVGDPYSRQAGAADVLPNVNDGHLFFQPVDGSVEPGVNAPEWADVGKGKLFHHIVGNVAEYVVSDTDPNEYLAAGGSAISPPLPFKEAVKLDARLANYGFPDLGVRLSFRPPIPPYYVRLNKALPGSEGLFITRPQ